MYPENLGTDIPRVLLSAQEPHFRLRIQRFARPLGGITVALAIVVLGIGKCSSISSCTTPQPVSFS